MAAESWHHVWHEVIAATCFFVIATCLCVCAQGATLWPALPAASPSCKHSSHRSHPCPLVLASLTAKADVVYFLQCAWGSLLLRMLATGVLGQSTKGLILCESNDPRVDNQGHSQIPCDHDSRPGLVHVCWRNRLRVGHTFMVQHGGRAGGFSRRRCLCCNHNGAEPTRGPQWWAL